MRFTIGSLMVILGAMLLVGPLVAPSLYDPFARSMVSFFGIAWGILGLMFWKAMPRAHVTLSRGADDSLAARRRRRSPVRPPS